MRLVESDALATRELRRAVLRPGWAPGTPMHADDRTDAVHVAALDDDETLLGTGLVIPQPYALHPEEPDAWQLRGMAVRPERQGAGVGTAVLAALIAVATERGGRLLWCTARSSKLGFYTRHGFAVEGPEFIQTQSGLPHHHMWRRIGNPDGTPPRQL